MEHDHTTVLTVTRDDAPSLTADKPIAHPEGYPSHACTTCAPPCACVYVCCCSAALHVLACVGAALHAEIVLKASSWRCLGVCLGVSPLLLDARHLDARRLDARHLANGNGCLLNPRTALVRKTVDVATHSRVFIGYLSQQLWMVSFITLVKRCLTRRQPPTIAPVGRLRSTVGDMT